MVVAGRRVVVGAQQTLGSLVDLLTLHQKLVQVLIWLWVGRADCALGAHSVQLVDEDDRGLVLARGLEQYGYTQGVIAFYAP